MDALELELFSEYNSFGGLKSVLGVGNIINCTDSYVLLDLVGVGDWKVPTASGKATPSIEHNKEPSKGQCIV